MPVSLNALFNVPTREEKSRKQLLDQQQEFAAGQAALEQSRLKERMSMADEMARGQARFAKELGIEFGQKEYDQVRANTLRELTAAGETPTAANEKLGKARSSPIYEGANKAVQAITGGLLGLPEQSAAADRNEAFARANEAKTRGMLAEGRQGIAYDLGGALGEADYANAVLAKEKAGADFRAVSDVAATEAAVREQTRQAAEDYKAQSTLRGTLNDVKLQEAQGRLGLLKQIAGSVYEPILYGGIDPRAYGFGVATPFGTTTMPLPDGSQPPSNVQGMLGRPKMTAEEALMKALEGRDVKIAQ